MKKLSKLTLLTVVVLTAFLLFACSGEITGMSVTEDTLRVGIGDSVVLSDCFKVEGKGKIYYTVENPEFLSVDKGILTGLAEGEGYVIANAGNYTERIKVVVYDKYGAEVKLKNATYTYDGTVKNVKVTGLPQGSEIRYFVDGEEFFGTEIPGVYEVKAQVELPAKYHMKSFVDTAVLIINRQTIIPAVKFSSAAYEYDGEEKSVEISGELPEGVTVSYENNRATDAGNYSARAVFSVDERFYEPISPMSAMLTIKKKPHQVDLSFAGGVTTTYDGRNKFEKVTLSEGIGANYYIFKDGKFQLLTDEMIENGALVNSGDYLLKAEFFPLAGYEKNYAVPSAREYMLTIKKATFRSDIRWEGSFDYTYDGKEKRIGREESCDLRLVGSATGIGEFTEGPQVKFSYGLAYADSLTFTDAGLYNITVEFIMPAGSLKNYEQLQKLPCSFRISKADYVKQFGIELAFDSKDGETEFADSQIEYDGRSHDFRLSFGDEEQEEKFFKDIEVTYTVNGRNTATVTVKDAGRYEIAYSLRFRSSVQGESADYAASLKRNYNLPANGGFTTTILKKVISLDFVEFEDDEFTYDGTEKSLFVKNLPSEVSVYYEGNSFVNAGTYKVKVNFYVVGDYDNYRFVRFGATVTSLTATAVVNKNSFDRAEIETKLVLDGGVYDPTKTLGDYELPAGYRWAQPQTKPDCATLFYGAIYNIDEKNYEDLLGISVRVNLERKKIDIENISVGNMFLPYTGSIVMPKAKGAGAEYVTVNAVCNDEGIALGKHDFSNVILEPLNGNYELTGEKTFADVSVYVYNGEMFEYEGTRLIKYIGLAVDVEIPDGTESVYGNAFNGTVVENLTLPKSITALSSNALSGAESLREVSLPFVGTSGTESFSKIFGGNVPRSLRKVTVTLSDTIPSYAFRNCDMLVEIEYAEEVVSVGEGAFYNCASLSRASFPGASIGIYAFYGCKGLRSLTLSVYTEGTGKASYLFGADSGENSYSLYSLETFDLSSGDFTVVNEEGFAGFTGLKKLILPYTVTQFGYGAFAKMMGEIVFKDGDKETAGNYTEIFSGMFADYEGTSLKLPSSVTRIATDGFKNVKFIEELILPKDVTAIDAEAFVGCAANIKFAGTAYTAVGSKAFSGFAGRKILLPSSVKTIGDEGFKNAKITNIELTEVESIGYNVFKGCTELFTVTVSLDILPTGTFSGCTSLSVVNLNGVERIASEAFFGCTKLESLTLPFTVTRISDRAFANCPKLASIVFEGEKPDFGNNVFTYGVHVDIYVPQECYLDYANELNPVYPSVDVNVYNRDRNEKNS